MQAEASNVLLLLRMRPHTAIYICSYTNAGGGLKRPSTTPYASSYCYICVLILMQAEASNVLLLLCMRPHTAIYMCAYTNAGGGLKRPATTTPAASTYCYIYVCLY